MYSMLLLCYELVIYCCAIAYRLVIYCYAMDLYRAIVMLWIYAVLLLCYGLMLYVRTIRCFLSVSDPCSVRFRAVSDIRNNPYPNPYPCTIRSVSVSEK